MAIQNPVAGAPAPAGETTYSIGEPIVGAPAAGGGGEGTVRIPELPANGIPLPGQGADGQPLPGYDWNNGGIIAPVTPGTVAPGSGTTNPYDQSSARGILGQALASIGLEDMTDWAYAQLVAGNAPAEILLNLRTTDRYKQRFIANDYRKKNGLNLLDEKDIIAYESGFRSLMNQYGVPASLYSTTDDIAKFLGEDLGLPELSDRIKTGFADVVQNPGLRSQFRDWYGPDGDTALALYFTDHDNSWPLLQKQVGAGTLGAASTRYGYTLSKQRAEELAGAGINLDPMSVNNAFDRLAKLDPLFHGTVDEGNRGVVPTFDQEGLNAAFGVGPGAEPLNAELMSREAQFGGGGAVKLAQERTGFGTSGQ